MWSVFGMPTPKQASVADCQCVGARACGWEALASRAAWPAAMRLRARARPLFEAGMQSDTGHCAMALNQGAL